METHTLHTFKKKAVDFFEHNILHTGSVLAVRPWESGDMIEVDLHLPETKMERWTEVPYLKTRVAHFKYRDYSASGWDAETSTCSLFVDSSHGGIGSDWARRLKSGTSHQSPAHQQIVALGDQTSIGHFLALEKMVSPGTQFLGALLFPEKRNARLFKQYFQTSSLEPLHPFDHYGHLSFKDWIGTKNFDPEITGFYIAGNTVMSGGLRTVLRQMGVPAGNIRVQGFWQ
jgi:NADPH-dependent ferric siderophore reductase